MSSVQSAVASPSHGARFFVAARATAPYYNASGALSSSTQALGTVVRDMGKTVRTPGISALSGVTTQLILRKVAKVGTNPTALVAGQVGTNGFVGFSEGAQDPNNTTLTFYINVYDGYWASI